MSLIRCRRRLFVTMLKYVLLVAFTANVMFIVLAADSNSQKPSHSSASALSSSPSSLNTSGSSSNSSSTSESSSSSHSSSNSAETNDNNDDDHCGTQNKCTRPNEEYVSCPDCSPQTCDSIGKIYHCPLQTEDNCNGTCRCKSGYFRNIIGECITKDECLMCNGTHEYFTCGGVCDNVCATLHKQNQTNCPIKNIQCNRKCYCEKGYARDNNNKCVPIEDCKEHNKCTGANEEYVSCPGCSPQTCDSIGKKYHCPLRTVNNCKGTCRCKSGYYRNKIGQCISKEECLMCKDTHEYFACGGACDNVCATLHEQNQTNCPIINKRCNRMCYCEEGYARDSCNKCVPIKYCTDKCTKPNEVYDTCPAPCPFRTCGIDDRVIFCAPPKDCPPPACRCQDGFYRDNKGDCVKWEDCPKCKNPNEEYDPCPAPCPPRRCDVDDRLIRCKAPPKLGDPDCEPGCRCSDGFARNDKGICVLRDECGKYKNIILDPYPKKIMV